jgi:hypothetical protein
MLNVIFLLIKMLSVLNMNMRAYIDAYIAILSSKLLVLLRLFNFYYYLNDTSFHDVFLFMCLFVSFLPCHHLLIPLLTVEKHVIR